MIKIIFLLVYDRPTETRLCLRALKRAKGIQDYQLLVVRQEGNPEVQAIIESIDWIDVHHITTTPDESWSGIRKINHNMFTGVHLAFEKHRSDFVIIVEDDIFIGYDFLDFCETIIHRYQDDNKFMAVNGFSREPYQPDKLPVYGKFKFGIGWGWAIHRNTWKNKIKSVWTGRESKIFDWHLEPTIRKGYVIMPYCSRVLNIGWNKGIHTDSDKRHPFYRGFIRSFVGLKPFSINAYHYDSKMRSAWRGDCIRYDRFVHIKECYVQIIRMIKWNPVIRETISKCPIPWIRTLFDIDDKT